MEQKALNKGTRLQHVLIEASKIVQGIVTVYHGGSNDIKRKACCPARTVGNLVTVNPQETRSFRLHPDAKLFAMDHVDTFTNLGYWYQVHQSLGSLKILLY